MQIIPFNVFAFARFRQCSEVDRRTAIKIANKALESGASAGAAYMAGRRYIRSVIQSMQTPNGAA